MLPFDKSQTALLLIDRNFDGEVDKIAYDPLRAGHWLYSIVGVDYDGAYDLCCTFTARTVERRGCTRFGTEPTPRRVFSAN